MTILQISAYYPPRLGGMQNVVRELAERLASEGHRVHIYTSSIGQDGHEYTSNHHLKYIFTYGFEFANTAIAPFYFFKLLRAPSDSIMHIRSPRPYISDIAGLVARIRKIPYVVHVHSDIQPLGKFKFLIPIYNKFSLSRLYSHADTVVFLSEAQANNAKKQYSFRNIAIIPNGVDESFYFKRSKLINKPARLLFVGRLNNQKNLPGLIESLQYITKDFTVQIVGDGNDLMFLKKMVKDCGLESKVEFSGKKTGEDLKAIYKSADIYTMSSNFEGFSLSMIEAMASSLPVVAMRAPGVTEHVKNVGVLVEKDNYKEFAVAIDKLIEDSKLYTSLSAKSFQYAQRHKWGKIVKQFEACYEKALK